jgi:hypothetical protein
MRRLLRLQLCLLAVLICPSAKGLVAGMQLAGYADDKQFLFTVWDEDLVKSPEWKADADNPPLAARVAIDKATELRRNWSRIPKT